jgi:hypothetical protein
MIRDWLRGLLLVAALLVAQGWVSADERTESSYEHE